MTIGSILGALRASALAGAIWAGVALLAVTPAALRAETLQDAAAGIEALIANGQHEDAVSAARDFLRQVTEMTGFGVANAQLIDGPASGFGVFEPRDSNVYVTGEPVYAYVELYGYSMSPQPSGAVQLLFDVSFTLESMDGEQITNDMVPMGDIRLETFSDPIDGYFHLTYWVTGATGAYNLRTHVTDRASGQMAVFTLPVVFADPSPSEK